MSELRPMGKPKTFSEFLEEEGETAPDLNTQEGQDQLLKDMREIYGELPPGLEAFIRGVE